MAWWIAMLLQAATGGQTPPAEPPSPPPLHGGPAKTTCPIGGETFEAWHAGSYSTYGARPDGRPYSYMSFPFPLPECPGNRLIVLGTYSPAELARLPAILAGAPYRRMIDRETSYYRAAWLATALGRGAVEALDLLLQATWQAKDEADHKPERRARTRRYQTEFAERVAALAPDTRAPDRVWLQMRAANALRELGRFREAELMRRRAEASWRESDDSEGWDAVLARLRVVIARRDGSSEPLDMIPESEAVRRCVDLADRGEAFDRRFCAQPAIAARVAQIRPARRTSP